ncbi:type II toxin-antitoxin system ParD family antitoxin [uncultured Maritimibacter sp.]|uniref:type II toxin-antitoxin system ParD family antitoxin n=1 Tax=uncultured Maritimibacter sp. TaxID=991866 RepID=UPI0026298D52|nr:type II toxin-antitoxin system ParD family antitoxin [uncultured Maritimibacter sp.]
MAKFQLTEPMQKDVQARIEVGAAQFSALKADLEHAAALAERGDFAVFDAHTFEPEAFDRRQG